MTKKYALCKMGNLNLGVKLVVDEFGNGNIYFQHPLNGQWCENIQQVFAGWSESEKDNKYWMKFVEAIKKDDMLPQKIYDEIEIIEYSST